MGTRAVLDALSKALVTVAVMLTILVIVKDPTAASQARQLSAVLLALGTVGLVALHGTHHRSRH